MTFDLLQSARDFVRSLVGLRCWYVSAGGSAGSTFQLALGGRVRRERPIKNPAHSAEFRDFEGEANLLVWCTWRLDGVAGPLASSDDNSDHFLGQLDRLRGADVRGAAITSAAGDLTLRFGNGLKLRVFCDHLPPAPSFDGNWELWKTDRALIVGPGGRVEFETRPANAPAEEKIA